MRRIQKIREWKSKSFLSDDITSKVVSFAFGLAAEIERQLISNRTKTALERAKQAGIHIGRRKGQKSSHYKLTPFSAYIMKEIKSGRSISSLAKEFHVSWDTIRNHIARIS